MQEEAQYLQSVKIEIPPKRLAEALAKHFTHIVLSKPKEAFMEKVFNSEETYKKTTTEGRVTKRINNKC